MCFKNGVMVLLNVFVKFNLIIGLFVINCFNMFISVMVNVLLVVGYVLGDVIKVIKEEVVKLLINIGYEWIGLIY